MVHHLKINAKKKVSWPTLRIAENSIVAYRTATERSRNTNSLAPRARLGARNWRLAIMLTVLLIVLGNRLQRMLPQKRQQKRTAEIQARKLHKFPHKAPKVRQHKHQVRHRPRLRHLQLRRPLLSNPPHNQAHRLRQHKHQVRHRLRLRLLLRQPLRNPPHNQAHHQHRHRLRQHKNRNQMTTFVGRKVLSAIRKTVTNSIAALTMAAAA